VDDVVKTVIVGFGGICEGGSVRNSILDDGGHVGWQLKVLCGKLVNDGVDLDDCCVDAVCYQGCRGCSNAHSAFDKVN